MRACLHADMPIDRGTPQRTGGWPKPSKPAHVQLTWRRESGSRTVPAQMCAGDEALLLHRRMLSRQPSAVRWKPSLISSEATCAAHRAHARCGGLLRWAEPVAASCCTLWCPVASFGGFVCCADRRRTAARADRGAAQARGGGAAEARERQRRPSEGPLRSTPSVVRWAESCVLIPL